MERIKSDEVSEVCMKEMFFRVGEKYPNCEFTDNTNWYWLRQWTMEDEESFKKWMIKYLRKSLRLKIVDATRETAMFLFMYGWKTKQGLGMEIIKNAKE